MQYKYTLRMKRVRVTIVGKEKQWTPTLTQSTTNRSLTHSAANRSLTQSNTANRSLTQSAANRSLTQSNANRSLAQSTTNCSLTQSTANRSLTQSTANCSLIHTFQIFVISKIPLGFVYFTSINAFRTLIWRFRKFSFTQIHYWGSVVQGLDLLL
jgi:hypothetical protein